MSQINKLFLFSGIGAFLIVFLLFPLSRKVLTGQANNENFGQNHVLDPQIVKKFNLDNMDLQQADSRQFYEKWLLQKEKEVWIKLEAVFGITQQECDTLKAEWVDAYNTLVDQMIEKDQETAQPSPKNLEIIEEVLQVYSIDCKAIKKISWTKLVSGGSVDSVVFFNDQKLTSMPLMVKKYVIAHEIAHIINKDHSTDFVLAQMRQINNIPETPEMLKALEDFAYFKELRADITAMLQGKEYALGQIMYMEHQIKCSGGLDLTSSTHPDDHVRYVIGKQFLKVC